MRAYYAVRCSDVCLCVFACACAHMISLSRWSMPMVDESVNNGDSCRLRLTHHSTSLGFFFSLSNNKRILRAFSVFDLRRKHIVPYNGRMPFEHWTVISILFLYREQFARWEKKKQSWKMIFYSTRPAHKIFALLVYSIFSFCFVSDETFLRCLFLSDC